MSLKSRAQVYFDRYAWQENILPDIARDDSLEMVIVLPSFNEKHTNKAVESIGRCKQPSGNIRLLIIVNEPETADQSIKSVNDQTIHDLESLQSFPDWLHVIACRTILPKKKAGVGLARKIGMDQAARWFTEIDKDGIIVCFDADSTCSTNFLVSVQKTMKIGSNECGICYYEHPLNEASGVIDYELHLRYYIDALRYAGYPYAFQTLGSCISVKVSRYLKSGGMNTRKAGEDFYFLHKIAPDSSIIEINDAAIYPSDRVSDRVPFGTGKALHEFQKKGQLLTYPLEAFKVLKNHFEQCENYLNENATPKDELLHNFLLKNNFAEAMTKARRQSNGNTANFRKLFFRWWDGFRVLKFIHFHRDHHQEMIVPEKAVIQLSSLYWKEDLSGKSKKELLQAMREKDQNYSKEFKSLTPNG